MGYEIVLPQQRTAETGLLLLHLDEQIEIQISAAEARRRANNWVHLEISSQIRAMQPQLVIPTEGLAHWRVPLHLTFPALGDVGPVGAVLVDVEQGVVAPSVDDIAEIKQNAQTLAQRFTAVPA